MSPAISPNVVPTDIDQRIARRVAELRAERGFTIEVLAARSSVSRATISKIERGQTSPTAAVLNRLAIGLGVLLPAVLGFDVRGPGRPAHPVARRSEQARWQDPATGYTRRTLTPPGVSQVVQLSEVFFPPGAHVTFENAAGPLPAAQQQIWVLAGVLHVGLGESSQRLTAGDCMAMTLDEPVTLHNHGPGQARYVVAVAPS